MLVLSGALILLLKFVAGIFRCSSNAGLSTQAINKPMSGGSGKYLAMLWLHNTEPHQCGSARLNQDS